MTVVVVWRASRRAGEAQERERKKLGLQGKGIEAQQQSHNCGFMVGGTRWQGKKKKK